MTASSQYESVNRAFSLQAQHYDHDDEQNPILKLWRKQVYNHVQKFMQPNSNILELNAGTGIDAVYFANQGHKVHATDLSNGMIEMLSKKSVNPLLQGRLTVQQCSFENLNEVNQNNFDYIFSNFGGLNCTNDLSHVTRHFPSLLKPNAYLTLVVMPRVCLWEILSILKGNSRALRRFQANGTDSHLENEQFKTHYFNLKAIIKAFDRNFRFIKSEGLGAISPPPSKYKFHSDHPMLYRYLNGIDASLRNHFPFNRWADHLIVTFQFKG